MKLVPISWQPCISGLFPHFIASDVLELKYTPYHINSYKSLRREKSLFLLINKPIDGPIQVQLVGTTIPTGNWIKTGCLPWVDLCKRMIYVYISRPWYANLYLYIYFENMTKWLQQKHVYLVHLINMINLYSYKIVLIESQSCQFQEQGQLGSSQDFRLIRKVHNLKRDIFHVLNHHTAPYYIIFAQFMSMVANNLVENIFLFNS